jgi:glucose-6-phosphate dehydrogenase assembly protein OpcA
MAHAINALTQRLVKPAQIETELDRIWEQLTQLNIVRASLFNLIIFHRESPRTDYLRTIVQKVVDQFPCRTLFVSHDATSSLSYLKTAVSVIAQKGEKGIACDSIDIGVAGSDWERVPYLIRPHLLPDLPVYLLWAEDPAKPHSLYDPLIEMATRVIFDSECIENLRNFARTLLEQRHRIEVADLNWVRLESWRDLFASTFETKTQLDRLRNCSSMTVRYNFYENKPFCHSHLQALYLCCWLSARLSIPVLRLKKKKDRWVLSWNQRGMATLLPESWKEVHPGGILSVEIAVDHTAEIQITRNTQNPEMATITISTKESCELPSHYLLGKTPVGQSLSRELLQRGTSPFFLETLEHLASL